MHQKKIILMLAFIVLSSVLAFSLSSLDFFGLFEKNKTLNIALMLTAVITTYLIAIIIFLLDFSDRHHLIRLYIIISLLFGAIVFILHQRVLLSVIIAIFFFGLTVYTYTRSLARSKLFVNFRPNDIFQPVVKNTFLWLVIIFASFSFIQTEKLAQQNSFISKLLTITVNQITPLLNKQISTQLTNQLKSLPALPNSEKEIIIRQVLSQTVNSLSQEQTTNWLGLKPQEIPIDKTLVSPNGTIDLKPVLNAMTPTISRHLTKKFGSFLGFAPAVVALLTIILLQSLLWPLHFIAGILTPVVFYILSLTGFIKKATEYVEVDRTVL